MERWDEVHLPSLSTALLFATAHDNAFPLGAGDSLRGMSLVGPAGVTSRETPPAPVAFAPLDKGDSKNILAKSNVQDDK
jgi:hypothetical protein